MKKGGAAKRYRLQHGYGPTRRCSCQGRADRVLPLGALGATMGAGTPAGAGARRLRGAVRGLAADRQVR